MSKRSNFDKVTKDYYPTIDPNAIPPKLIPKIRGKTYAEPCCGQGHLVDLLAEVSICRWESDLEDRGAGQRWDALCLTKNELEKCDLIITNPPFTKNILLPLIDKFVNLKETYLLLPADLMHNKYFIPYMDTCSNIFSVGRLYWFKSDWVRKKPVDYDDLPQKYDKKVEYYDAMTGTKYYTGWWDNHNNKPSDSEFIRGTDNYCWYHWKKGAKGTDTVYHTR